MWALIKTGAGIYFLIGYLDFPNKDCNFGGEISHRNPFSLNFSCYNAHD